MEPFYLLVYSHKHGEDYSLYPTEGAAERAAACIMVTWLGDLPSIESQSNILACLEAADYSGAMSGWEELTDERLTIEPVACFSDSPVPSYERERARINELLAHEHEED